MAKTKKTPKQAPPNLESVESPELEQPAPETESTELEAAAPIVPEPPKPKVVRSDAGRQRRPIPVWAWVVGGLVVVAGAAVAGYVYWSAPANEVVGNGSQNTNSAIVVETAPRIIDGVIVPATATNPNLQAVMIENARESRPPAGLDKASIVYEVLAEGGITRFMAMFTIDTPINEIGPIRSARPYYIDWASEYNRPLYVHAGESPQSMLPLRSKKTTILDVNLLRYGKYGYRVSARVPPHNLFSSSERLKEAFNYLYPKRTPKFVGWLYADDSALELRPETVNTITINYSALAYRVDYNYDRAENTYLRSVGGQLHKTHDGAQLTAKNVIVQYVATTLYPNERQRLKMTTVGSGQALIFRNGEAIVGTWKKDATENRTIFYTPAGEQVTLTRGTTWVEVIPTGRSVTY